MTSALLDQIHTVITDAGFGPGSGLTFQDCEDGVRVSWKADAIIRPTIAAHASDPELRDHATVAGLRSVVDHALTALFLGAGLHTTAPLNGVLLVTRPPRAFAGQDRGAPRPPARP
ncbi:hypothetical protein ACFQ8C_09570 [Streptomyces sp. NPDC056503]|uniref:hypothetical protein n=1 Tax=Streptomyces sp. NPDC056503 TaxID=3345842 RepID=UPI00367ED117